MDKEDKRLAYSIINEDLCAIQEILDRTETKEQARLAQAIYNTEYILKHIIKYI